MRHKTLSVAFLISVSWHILFMLCFTIVVLPISFPMSKISNVSFLGPILEKTAFELMLEKRPQSKRASYREGMPVNNIFLSHEEKILDKLKFDDSFLATKQEATKFSASDLIGDFKLQPPFRQASPALSTYELTSGFRRENLVIEGLPANREILFAPESPVLLKKIDAHGKSFIVEVKFSVSRAGKVEEAVLLASSGYPDVDITAINYIKGFQFSSLDSQDRPTQVRAKLNLKSK